MKRIISVLAVMAIMAAMVAASVMPAFAASEENASCVGLLASNFGGSNVASLSQAGESPGGETPGLANNKRGQCGRG
jgi:Tfp pilus assembly protein FimT